MRRRFKIILTMIVMTFAFCQSSHAFSLALDSIATWGKFPKFCIDVYKWGDRFFNSYDTAYVNGTGYKFNIKFKTDSWNEYSSFYFDNSTKMKMQTDPTTQMGFWLTYLAVSVGYDKNVSTFFTGKDIKRERFVFQFNCSLLAAEFYYYTNNVVNHITEFSNKNDKHSAKYSFDGVNNKSLGVETYYFFNHKKYSQSAAFSFSKIQKKSAGSFYSGISISMLDYNFDFNKLPEYMKSQLPKDWPNFYYKISNNTYAIKLGYAYNWVFARNWLIGVSVSPTIGFRYENAKDFEDADINFSLNGKSKLSLVYNNNRWFVGVIGKHEFGIINGKGHSLLNTILGIEASVGWRFNLW